MANLDALEKKKLSETFVEALSTSAEYLIEELPFTVQVVADARFLHPLMRTSKVAPEAIRRLCSTILPALPDDFIKKKFQSISSESTLVTDLVMSEFKMYQLESIPKSFYEEQSKKKTSSDREQSSYWKYAYGIADVQRAEPDTDSAFIRIDKYWSKVRL